MLKNRVEAKVLSHDDELKLERLNNIYDRELKSKGFFKTDVIWVDAFILLLNHLFTLAVLLTFPYQQKWKTVLFFLAYTIISVLGSMVFAHRYLSHRSFKANFQMKIIMMCLYAASGQYSAYSWAKDHRVHHKYCDTMADPYNAKRGFLFSHVGWVAMKRTPQFFQRAKLIDMNDFKSDRLLILFERNFHWFYMVFTLVLPTLLCCYFWKETFFHAFAFNLARIMVGLNCAWTINSLSHNFGERPYDKTSTASENLLVNILTCGEGSHNYHHKFPWDYKAANADHFNLSAGFIKLFSQIGWTYDLKEAAPDLVDKVMQNNKANLG